jgi:hypothetical protein
VTHYDSLVSAKPTRGRGDPDEDHGVVQAGHLPRHANVRLNSNNLCTAVRIQLRRTALTASRHGSPATGLVLLWMAGWPSTLADLPIFGV